MGFHSTDQARAARYLARVNIKIIQGAAAARQGHVGKIGAAPGARSPAGLAAAPIQGRQLVAPRPGGKSEPITPVGYMTAVRRLPRALSRLSDHDPRLRAAMTLADAAERVGSVRGTDLLSTDNKGGLSDGGATSRLAWSTRLRMIEAYVNGWAISATGAIRRGPAKVAIEVVRQTGERKEIRAFDAVYLTCVEGVAVVDMLRACGWSDSSGHRAKLVREILAGLDDAAEKLGYGRSD